MIHGVRAALVNGERMVYLSGCAPVPADARSMAQVREAVPSLRPVPLGLAPSFGFGDRTGLATPGHAAALPSAGSGILPIFAQQSIREMARTGRTPQDVMDDATFGALLSGYDGRLGADADHLKTDEDVERTAAGGFTFFTLDPSGDVDPHADDYPEAELRERFAAIREAAPWVEQHRGREVRLATGTALEFTEEVLLRAAVKYGRALVRTIALARYVERVMAGCPYEIEVSVDETEQPTSPAEHWIVAEQCREAGVRLVSLAPRYPGVFEKGVDFRGDREAFRAALADHAAIAAELGPYKLSLHSGSDKLSIYADFARLTRGMFHVKTAGTSYLEALRVVARQEPSLFREIVDFARGRYAEDRATYHVSASVEALPAPVVVADNQELERAYLGLWEDVPAGAGFSNLGRQVVHTTFGSVLQDPCLRAALFEVLEGQPGTYAELLEEHFARHLRALAEGM